MAEHSSEYHYLLYGLVVGANAPIGGAPPASRDSAAELIVDFNPLDDPSLLREGTTTIEELPRNAAGDRLFTLFHRGDDYLFDFPDGAQFLISGDAAHVRASWPPHLDATLAAIYFINTVMAFILRLRGDEVLHASAALIDGRAVAFIGPSGAGKSTVAACLARRGFPILSEDVTALVETGDRFFVLPAHSRIRLWPDSAALLFGSADELPLLAGEDWKRYADVDSCAPLAAESFELIAIYSLDDRRDTTAQPSVQPLAERDALLDLIANTYHNIRDPRLAPASFERLGRLVERVALRLALPHKELSTAFAFADAIVNDFRRVVATRLERTEAP
jgi:hypothetical protein